MRDLHPDQERAARAIAACKEVEVKPVLFYDISTDERRPVTQADVDALSASVSWNLHMREIVSALTGNGNRRFSREQLDKTKEVLGLS